MRSIGHEAVDRTPFCYLGGRVDAALAGHLGVDEGDGEALLTG